MVLTDEQKKANKKAGAKKRYENNKEKLKENAKKWYENNKERGRENNKKWCENNKAKRKTYEKKRYENNKEKLKENAKKYREKNKEKVKEYRQTPSGKKSRRICKWKSCGVIYDDWDKLYEKYINTTNCELCEVELTEDKRITKTTRCLDHDHYTGLFRNIVCWNCNLNILPKQT